MGLDFVRKAAKSFHKGLDKSKVVLGTPDLFTNNPICEPRAYSASVLDGSDLAVNEDLCIRLQASKVIAIRGMRTVAELNSPPEELIRALEASFGEAAGTVISVYPFASTAEIAVC